MNKQNQGLIFVISAPSGTGKTTLVKALLKNDPHIQCAITHTTRPQRNDEVQAQHYYFVSKDEFSKLKKEDFFVETAEVYGHCYGTSKQEINKILDRGQDVILNLDWQGARSIRSLFKDRVKSIFIMPPSLQHLEDRMHHRGDPKEHIHHRLQSASDELKYAEEYDYRLLNDDFDAALQELQAIIQKARTSPRHPVEIA